MFYFDPWPGPRNVWKNIKALKYASQSWTGHQPMHADQIRERGMIGTRAGIMPATGNCLIPQMQKPVASMIRPPQAEKSDSISGVVKGKIRAAAK